CGRYGRSTPRSSSAIPSPGRGADIRQFHRIDLAREWGIEGAPKVAPDPAFTRAERAGLPRPVDLEGQVGGVAHAGVEGERLARVDPRRKPCGEPLAGAQDLHRLRTVQTDLFEHRGRDIGVSGQVDLMRRAGFLGRFGWGDRA